MLLVMSNNVKLSYFDLNGLGEVLRWLLKCNEMEFEDIRHKFEDWLTVKPTTPFGQLPSYEENGKVVCQSIAIARYLGKRAKLGGDTLWEDLEIDAIVDTINDLRLKLKTYSYEKNEAIKASVKGEILDVALPFYMEKFEKIAEVNGGHLAVNKLTWADFYFVAALDYFNWMAERDIVENYPNLGNVKENVLNVSVIKDWVAHRPTVMF